MPLPESLSKGFDVNRDYIKLVTNQPVRIRFLDFGTPEFYTQETRLFEGKDTTTIQFNACVNLDDPKRNKKTFRTTSEKLCRKLWGFFDRNYFDLTITRTGEGFDTDYDIYPDDKVPEPEGVENDNKSSNST